MKIKNGIAFILLMGIFTLQAQSLDRVIDNLVVDFSLNFKEAHPDLVYRPNIGIMPFEETSELAKKYSVGETITAFFENKMAKSLFFALIDDKSRQKLIEEMKFALSGLGDSDRIEAGGLEGIDIFIGGTVTEVGRDFVILMKAVEVNTGGVIYSGEALIDQDLLVDAARELAGTYVSPYGIGVDFSYAPYVSIQGAMVENEGQIHKPRFFNANISYRISRNLLAWVGGDFYGGSIFTEGGSEEGLTLALSDAVNLTYTETDTNASLIYKKFRSYWQTSLGLGYVINISRTFNLTLGAEFRSGIVYITQEYTMVRVGDPTTYYSNIILSQDSWLTSLRPLIKAQYFITPRLAVNVAYGFNWQFGETKPSRYVFQDSYYDSNLGIPLLWDLDPSLDPQGNEHVTDLTGHRIDAGLSLYF